MFLPLRKMALFSFCSSTTDFHPVWIWREPRRRHVARGMNHKTKVIWGGQDTRDTAIVNGHFIQFTISSNHFCEIPIFYSQRLKIKVCNMEALQWRGSDMWLWLTAPCSMYPPWTSRTIGSPTYNTNTHIHIHIHIHTHTHSHTYTHTA
jgi:hypothetical protein